LYRSRAGCGEASRALSTGKGKISPLGMKIWSVGDGSDIPDPHDKIAKMLARLPLLGIALNDRLERGEDLLLADVLTVQPVHPRAGKVGSEVQVVLAQAFADKANFSQVGPGATVGTAGHADHDFVIGETGF